MIWATLLALSLFTGHACAETEINTLVDDKPIYVGDGFNWTITVKGATTVSTPETPELLDFFIRTEDPRIVEKGTERTYVFRYRLIPRRAGLLTLPPVEFLADGEILTSTEQALTVNEIQTTTDLRLEVSLDKKTAYTGEPVVATVTWLSALPLPSIKAVDIRFPLLYHPDFTILIPDEERTIKSDSTNTIGLPVEGQRVTCVRGTLHINEKTFYTLTFRRILIPQKPGDYTLEPGRLFCAHVPSAAKLTSKSTRYPSYFDNDFFQETESNENFVRYSVKSEPTTLQVRALPEAGRPAHFTGIIGSGGLSVEAVPQSITLGDPITLTLRLKGFARPEGLILPPLSQLGNFGEQFLIPDEQAAARIQKGDAVFIQSIRPTRTAVTQIPALQVSIFNPANEQYETLTTEPIAIRVNPDGDITELDLGPEAPSIHTSNPTGIWHNLPPGTIEPISYLGRLLGSSALYWFIIPPLVFWACQRPARLYRLKNNDHPLWQKITAHRRMRREWKRARDLNAKNLAVVNYLATRLEIQPGALSFHEARRSFSRLGIKLSDAEQTILQTWFNHRDQTRFGHPSPMQSPDAVQLLATLDQLERKFSP